MAVPATTGKLCTTIEEMKIGDYVAVSNDSTYGHRLGDNGLPEIPVTGNTDGMGFYYFVKVDKGLLISDRVTRHSISWSTLNSDRSIEGAVMIYGTTQGIRRSLSSGVAYADINGNMSLTNKGYGAWPTNDEWDKYIVNFPSHKIQEGRAISDIWNFESVNTWMQETPVNGLKRAYDSVVGANTFRIVNSYQQHFLPSTNSYANTGFRPVFEYKEV